MINIKFLLLVSLIILTFLLSGYQFPFQFDRYHTPEELISIFKKLTVSLPNITKLHPIGKSPGNNLIYILEIGSEVGKVKKDNPAVLVVANLDGIHPISTEGSLKLVKLVIEKDEARKNTTWYILPNGNPDAASRFFKKPLNMESRNFTPRNDDMDESIDEDGVEDLNADGMITQMRKKDPKGEWIPLSNEPRMMRRADWSKGERGIYKLYSEGIDNDGDGEFNEDGTGGVDISINFPHLFKFFTANGGTWAGCEAESFHLIEFAFQHQEIAMTVLLGNSNFCMVAPRGGRRETADFSKIKIPERIGKIFRIDTSRTYTMEEVMELVKRVVPKGFEVTESMVASFLGLGAIVNPLPSDSKFYQKLADEFKSHLKEHKLDVERVQPEPARDGSFELWSYYHLGLPSFSMDFWALPQKKNEKSESELTPEKLEKMSTADFVALGEEKIDSFLKHSGAPGNINAKMIINALQGGMMTTKKMAEMLRNMPRPEKEEGGDPLIQALLDFSDNELQTKGFVPWKSFQHPTLGQIEIGGVVPFTTTTPPPYLIEKLLDGQVPWLLHLATRIARIKIGQIETKNLGRGVYKLSIRIENTGYLPYPIEMGRRNNRITPVVVTVQGNGIKILEGKNRNLIDEIPGNGLKELNLTILSEKPTEIHIRAVSPMAGKDSVSFMLGGLQ